MGKMSQSDASRVQSSQAKSGGDMTSGGFAARAQGAGDRNANTATSQGTQSSGGQTGTGGGKSGTTGAGTGTGGSNTGASQKK